MMRQDPKQHRLSEPPHPHPNSINYRIVPPSVFPAASSVGNKGGHDGAPVISWRRSKSLSLPVGWVLRSAGIWTGHRQKPQMPHAGGRTGDTTPAVSLGSWGKVAKAEAGRPGTTTTTSNNSSQHTRPVITATHRWAVAPENGDVTEELGGGGGGGGKSREMTPKAGNG